MRKIDKIILHCAATPEGKDFTVKDIDNWHRQRGFNEIGYHYVIYRDGTIHNGRSIEKVGAHTTGQNSNSIGICYIGGLDASGKLPKDTRTPEQRFALFKLVDELRHKYNIPIEKVYGHREFANKACPSFDMNTFRKELKSFCDNRPAELHKI